MSKNNEIGCVYILTNQSFREDWIKIGKSGRSVDVRSKELDNTAVPLPFEIYATIQSKKYNEIETSVHNIIDGLTDLRIRQNREFFNISPENALGVFRDVAKLIDDAVIYRYIDGVPTQIYPKMCIEKNENTKEIQNINERKPNFTFDMVGLSVGDKIVFDPSGIELTIGDYNKVEYEGRLWSLNAFCQTFMPENKKFKCKQYQGSRYFSYNGKTLIELREEC